MSANIIYKYPLSSCNCYECNKNNYNNEIGGISTNSSIGSCKNNDKYQCYNNINFINGSKNILPKSECGYINLNPDMGVDLSKDFTRMKCNKSNSCKNEIYLSKDPRLVDSIRAIRMPLDRPPYNGEVQLNNIYDSKYTKYGKDYSDYNSIRGGQIMYYYDKSIQNPFYEPNFTIPAKVDAYLYKDPMDNYKPYYTHNTVNDYNPMLNSGAKSGCLTDISDSLYHREDIMSKQMDLTNRTKYTARWPK